MNKNKSCKRRRSRSNSRSPPKPDEIFDYQGDLRNYLEDYFNIKNQEEFWKFFQKYETTMKLRKSRGIPILGSKVVCTQFSDNEPELNLKSKFPIYSRRGNKIKITKEQFQLFLNAILAYQDFQQKSKFTKLKMLRKAQEDLPIAKFKAEIIRTINENQVILIAGDTGCGKSTQVPQYVMEAGYKKIVCTQPRRIACISLAKRVSYETLTTYKNRIGFQIRFERAKNKNTKVVFVTEGILLRQANDDDILSTYDVIILDEVHERHLNMDFLIGIVKCLVRKRSFKLILMSATINLELFQNYFESEGVKTIKVPGRLYPIDIDYRPIKKDVYDKKNSKFDCQPYINILQLIDSKYKTNELGDVLIFLNGFNEINTLANAITQYAEIKKNWIVLQLHSSLSLEEQDKVFHFPPDGVRKCIISTNIAETSVTIDGIRFVIDSGKVNRMSYENLINRLFETNISQDSAKQRAGRAGRTGPGICYRLYSKEELKQFTPYTPAEIHLVPLENLILNMVSLGLTNIEAFPFLEKPSDKSLRSALDRLSFLEALNCDDDGLSLTTLGDAMSRLPVDLTVSKMLLMSTIFGTVNSALALASILSVQNPIIENKYFETRDNRTEYISNHGEPITLINLLKGWLNIKQEGSYVRSKGENSRIWSRRLGIEEQRFYEITKLIEQFRDILQDASLIPKVANDSQSSSERALRNGEVKHLRKIRSELKNSSRDFKRKKLDLAEKEDKADSYDLRDVEFRLSNNFKKLNSLLRDTRTNSYKDIMLLKLLLTGALYPQIAIEDEFNSSKTVNERLLHTIAKQYVSFRPTSYFSEDPEFLQLADSDIDIPPLGYFSRQPLSRKHQILVYQKLLETKKTFLINTFRMPALQTLLLFGRQIATNSILTKFIFDDFLCVECPFLWEGKVLLMKSIKLRKMLKHKLETKLKNEGEANDGNKEFLEDLVEFTQTNVSYNIKRLLPADIKVVYNYEAINILQENPFNESFKAIPNKLGGVNVTDHVIYNCLNPSDYDIEIERQLSEETYVCPSCKEAGLGRGVLDILLHDFKCKTKSNPDKEIKAQKSIVKENIRNFNCDVCKKELLLSPIDILKHKKYCVPIKAEID